MSSLLTRRQGLVVFLALLCPLAPALWAFRRGRRQRAYQLLLVMLLAVGGAGALEVSLRLAPNLLQGQLANVGYSGYHWLRGGVYDLDATIGPILRPNVSRGMYWSGRRWWHEVNGQGFRGASVDRAESVFLGDSLVYGHAVEQEDTVPARFGRVTGRRVANLGQQGTCLVQDLLIFRKKGLRLEPRTVFLCAHFNDVADGLTFYDEAELRRFVRDAGDPRVRPEYQPRSNWDPVWLWSRYIALPTQGGGVLSAAIQALRRGGGDTPVASRDPFVPTKAEQTMPVAGLDPSDGAAEQLSWRAQVHALALLKADCDRLGARLVVFDVGYPRGFSAAVEAAAGDTGALYSPAGRVALARALSGVRVYLADDGHWSGAGAAVVAAELARMVPRDEPHGE